MASTSHIFVPCPGVWQRRSVIGVIVCMLPTLVTAQQTEGLNEEPSIDWPGATVNTLRTFFERVDVEAVLVGLTAPRARTAGGDLETLDTVLAPGLEAPFRFVQRRVRHEPYAGNVRGARGALLAGSANALDQSLLLATLYRARGTPIRLIRGRLGWRDAVALVGEPPAEPAGRGDPWLRWVEIASDHWWVEARQSDRWIALDPSFASTAVGETVGTNGEVVDTLPRSLRAFATLRLQLARETLAELDVPLSSLIGSSVRVDRQFDIGEQEAEAAEELDGAPVEDPDAAGDDNLEEEPPDAAALAEARLAVALADVITPVPVGSVALRLRAAGQIGTTPLLELADLARVELEIDVDVPMGSGIQTRIPVGADPHAHLSVVFASGPMPRAHLQDRVIPLFDSLSALSAVELAALEAWTARPRPRPRPVGPVGPVLELEPPGARIEAGDPEHPVTALHVAVLRAWRTLQEAGLDAIAVALLMVGDALQPPPPTYRGSLRMAAVQWTPPVAEAEGWLTVWMTDPLRLGGRQPAQRSGLASAYGLLRSALTGQVLHRVADRPPVTAFDVTLRAVGTGGRLQWWRADDDLPSQWPAAAQAAAQVDLGKGRLLAGLARPVEQGGETLHGWWGVFDQSGQTLGRVLTPSGIAQGFVRFARPRDDMSLESVLATLHDLHAALRWLIGAASDDGQELDGLLPGACAATPLVFDLLRAGAPAGTVAPTFEVFCTALP